VNGPIAIAQIGVALGRMTAPGRYCRLAVAAHERTGSRPKAAGRHLLTQHAAWMGFRKHHHQSSSMVAHDLAIMGITDMFNPAPQSASTTDLDTPLVAGREIS